MPDFIAIAAFLGLALLVWNCIEVGRNDAANLVNAVFGARVLTRQRAVMLAAVAVVLGAGVSSSVMETARKGIFDPTVLTVGQAMAVYISVYFVNTVLLFAFSGFGMPVSTTACLVFELVGASLFLVGPANVHWPKVQSVITAIVVSIFISCVASFLIMRIFRGAIRERAQDRRAVILHGPWIAGAMFTGLTWFMVFKGLDNIAVVKDFKAHTFETYGEGVMLLALWAGYTLLTHLVLVMTHRKWCRYLFSFTAVLGMLCMAFAFGQNDLANAASPGLAGLNLWQHGEGFDSAANLATKIPIGAWALVGCGVLMASGMFTTYAQRVTRAEVNTASQFDQVALYAPRWCKVLARWILPNTWQQTGSVLAPPPTKTTDQKKIHYDTLRASVITGVGASVIAFASGRGLPVSTTYVAFAAVIGTGLSDRVFARGDSDTKIGRAIWVVSCWFIAPFVAMIATGLVAVAVYNLRTSGLVVCLLANLGLRFLFQRYADRHEKAYHPPTDGDDDGGGSPNAAASPSSPSA